MVKIIILLFISCGGLFQVYSQDITGIKRLGSTRSDVIKLLGKGQEISQSKTVYDLPDKKLIVFYFGETCLAEYLIKNQITKDTVMSLTIIPKIEQLISSVPRVEQFKEINLLDNRRTYLNSGLNEIIVSRVANKGELIETLYYLPLELENSICQTVKTDKDSGFDLYEKYQQIQRRSGHPVPGHPVSIGSYRPSGDSISSLRERVKLFCEKLPDFPNGIGQITITLSSKENKSRYVYYENYINRETRKNTCDLSKVKIVRERSNPNLDKTSISFYILPDKNDPPR